MKRCHRCKAEKPASEFYRDRSKSDGLSSACKPCAALNRDDARARRPEHYRAVWRARNRRHYERNRSEYAERSRRWRYANERAARLVQWRSACRRRGLEVTPEVEEHALLLLGDPCAYCGEPTNGIDHIVPVVAGGANAMDNLTAACRDCNGAKQTRSLLGFLLAR